MYIQADSLKATQRMGNRTILVATMLLVALLLIACQGGASPESAEPSSGVMEGDTTATPGQVPAGLVEIAPLDVDAATAPVRLEIPDVGIDAPVTPMEWAVVTLDGERTTMWTVPLESVGWHVNSAGAGAAGNTAISGYQKEGNAYFAPLALGSVQPGQEIRLTDSDGLVFVYTVREISDPIPLVGATDDEKAKALAFLVSGNTAQLTLITGWPEFTTTHRIFAAADFLGTLN